MGVCSWRRRELNPRPEITPMAASTCIVAFLISTPAAGSDTLRRDPVVFISLLDQRPNQEASPRFATDVLRASHRVEVALIRQPYEPVRQSRPGLQHHWCWQLKLCSMFYEANERPRHATATVVIRSKPIAPGGEYLVILYRSGHRDNHAICEGITLSEAGPSPSYPRQWTPASRNCANVNFFGRNSAAEVP